jgi:PAS domain S-box-containing protein
MRVDSLSRGYRKHDVPAEYVRLWQAIVDSIATIFAVPVALITRVHAKELEVLVRNSSENNPFQPGEMLALNEGHYCEQAMIDRNLTEVVDATQESEWSDNPALAFGLRSYLGIPLLWPNGETFGTLCLMSEKPSRFDQKNKETLFGFKDIIERDMVINERNAELSKAYRELQESEEKVSLQHQRLRNILEITRTGTWQWNLETNEIIIDDQWASIIGYRSEELEPFTLSTWEKLVHSEDLENALRKVNQLMNGDIESYNVEFRQRHKDGSWVWINSVGNVLKKTYYGKPVIMGGYHLDINERKRQELQLAQQEETYRKIFHSNLAMKLIIDPGTGAILEANQSALNYYGYSQEEITSIKISDINTLSAEEVKSEMQRAVKEDRTYFNFQHRKKNGEVRDVAVYSGPIQRFGKDVLYSIILDVMDFKRE